MPEEIKVKYEYASDYRKIPATGAWGGLTPNGEVVINFYVEFTTKPEEVIVQLDVEGKVIQESKANTEVFMTRELLVGVVMRPDIAKLVGQFLINQAEIAEEAMYKRKESLVQSKGD